MGADKNAIPPEIRIAYLKGFSAAMAEISQKLAAENVKVLEKIKQATEGL